MKNVILVAILAVTLTAACLWYFLPNNQAPVFIGGSEVIGGSIHDEITRMETRNGREWICLAWSPMGTKVWPRRSSSWLLMCSNNRRVIWLC